MLSAKLELLPIPRSDDPEDADYAIAEDITDSDYDIAAFKNNTYTL